MKGALWRLAGGTALMASLAGLLGGSVTVTLAPTGPATFRWLDIADYVYGTAFQGSYVYDSASVTFTHDDPHFSLHGWLSGSGLKPNFAYQIKIEGKPTLNADLTPSPDADETANGILGKAGRWWITEYDEYRRYVGAYNYDNVFSEGTGDDWYNRIVGSGFVDPLDGHTYIFKGYLLFDYVVTTPQGEIPNPNGAGYEILADNSFHVLWKTTQRTPTASDSVPTLHVVKATPEYYDPLRREKKVAIYGEGQSDRPAPGQLQLQDGPYHAVLLLTEESFHSTHPLGGNWAKALGGTIAFTVSGDPPGPTDPPGALTGTVRSSATGRGIANAAVTVADAAGIVVSQTLADRKGRYSIADLAAGSCTVTASASGYITKAVTAGITSGQTTTVDLALTPSP